MLLSIVLWNFEHSTFNFVKLGESDQHLTAVNEQIQRIYVDCLFVALRPKSTAMIMAGGSVHLTTIFPGLA